MIQCQFINKLLDKRDPALLTTNNLTDEFFSDYKEEYKFLKHHIDQYGAVPDKATFLSRFPNFDIIEVNEPDNYLVDELYDDRNKRTLARIFNQVRDLLNAGKTDQAVKLYTTAADQVVKASHITSIDLFQDTSRYDAYVEKINNFDKYYAKTGFKELDEAIGGWDRKEELATIIARPGSGKCLERGTLVLMADGSLKAVEKIQVGDKVQSERAVNTVLALHSGQSNGYRIIPCVGDPFVVSANHILTLAKRRTYWDRERKMSTSSHQYDIIDVSVEEYLSWNKTQRRLCSLYKPAVEYAEKSLSIPPYILGIWLGDGTASYPEITSMDQPVVDAWCQYAQDVDLRVKVIEYPASAVKTYRLACEDTKVRRNTFTSLLRELNVYGNKHIPLDFLTGSREQRMELLAGLLDTDGYYNGRGVEIVFANETLLRQTAQLARGLGFRTTNVSHSCVKGFDRWGIVIYGPHLDEIPLRVPRRRAAASKRTNRVLNLTGFSIEPVDSVEYYGFQVDGDHRFMLADNTLTHNSMVSFKTAIAAAEQGLTVGIYSGEMSEDKVGYRVDTMMSHISNTKMMHGNGDIQADYKRFLENLRDTYQGTIKVLTPSMIGGPAGVSTLRSFVERDHLDMLVVDQHSLLEDDRHGRTSVEKAANISKDLKNLQVMMKIPIIAVSQQNRESTDNGVSVANVAQSDRIGQDSTIVLALEKKDAVLSMHIIKARDGGDGKTLKYAVDFDKGIWTFIPTENDALNGEKCEELEQQFEYVDSSEQEGLF